MEILNKHELWRHFLQKEPTKRRYLFHGLLYYIIMCRRYPVRALAEIAACALIFGLMFLLLWMDEIFVWVGKP